MKEAVFDKNGNCFTEIERKKFFTKAFRQQTKGCSDKQRLETLALLGLL